MIAPIRKPLFDLGKVIATRAALQAIEDSGERPEDFLNRHVYGDWGMIFAEDRERNERALAEGGEIVSAYRTGNGVKVWVITRTSEPTGDSAAPAGTTILLPSERPS